MVVRKAGMWNENIGKYRTIVFQNASIIEKDQWIRIRKQHTEDGYFSNISYLYNEIHILFDTTKGLAYLTINCQNITYKDGEEL